MNYPDIIDKVSKELDISVEVVDAAYKSYWKFIKQTIQSLPLNDDISEEDFTKLRTNFNIGSLGKLYVTYEHYIGIKKRFEYLRKIKDNENKRRDKEEKT